MRANLEHYEGAGMVYRVMKDGGKAWKTLNFPGQPSESSSSVCYFRRLLPTIF